jgi:hypothetical protein
MAAALIVMVIIVAVAVGWSLVGNLGARSESRASPAQTAAPAFVPAVAPSTHASGNQTTIVLAPLPPKFDREILVKSRSEKGKTYRVNLGRLTCTCLDFEKRRASLPADDIRRVCKHLGRTLQRAEALSLYGEVAQAFIRPQKASRDSSIEHGVNSGTFIVLPDGTDEVVFAFSLDSAWVDVVTRRGTNDRIKKYKRYSYNVDERRWSYGSAPFADGEIRQAIHAHFRG